MIASLVFSFLDLKITDGILSAPEFVDLRNYRQMLNDPQIWTGNSDTQGSLWIIIRFGLIALPVGIGNAMLIMLAGLQGVPTELYDVAIGCTSFFANAYNVFLLRQCFMTIPRGLDEVAMMDGAGPLRILWSVILPISYLVLLAVMVFHIVWAWSDFFGPLIYLRGVLS